MALPAVDLTGLIAVLVLTLLREAWAAVLSSRVAAVRAEAPLLSSRAKLCLTVKLAGAAVEASDAGVSCSLPHLQAPRQQLMTMHVRARSLLRKLAGPEHRLVGKLGCCLLCLCRALCFRHF